MISPIVTAKPAFDAAITPYSPEYGDVYHSADSGPGQARHVFLGGNGMPAPWLELVKRDETQSRVEFSP